MIDYEDIMFPKNKLDLAIEKVEAKYGALKYAPRTAFAQIHEIVRSNGMLGNQYDSRRKQ